MTGPQIIVLATPVFLLLIGIEFLIGVKRGVERFDPPMSRGAQAMAIVLFIAVLSATTLPVVRASPHAARAGGRCGRDLRGAVGSRVGLRTHGARLGVFPQNRASGLAARAGVNRLRR
jgi:hypothetical protein